MMKKWTRIVAALMVATSTAIFVSCNKEEDPVASTDPIITDFSPKEGRVGQEVTITGEKFGDFADAVDVKFNGKAATISSLSDTQIVAVAPSGGTTGTISVSVYGVEVVSSESFTFLASATVTGISSETGAPGDQISISGTNFGTDASIVSVEFAEDVAATVVSVSETEIVVEVPEGGITGAIKVTVGTETIEGPIFNYPFVGVNSEFDTDAEGWLAQQDGSASVADGMLNVSFASGASRADLRFDGSVLMDAGSFPILAIRMTRLGEFNLTLDTDLGSFEGGANKYTGIIDGDIYYWDLTQGEFVHGENGNTALSTTEETLLEMIQFKIADVKSGETGYDVAWIRSFENLETLKAYDPLPTGKYVWEFDNVDDPQWSVQASQTPAENIVVENSILKVTFQASQFEGTNKRRADLYYAIHNTFPWTGTQATGPEDPTYKDSITYHKDYPIYAIKFTNDSKPSSGAFKRDFAFGVQISDNTSDATTDAGDGVYFWDMSDPDTPGGKFVDETAEGFDATTGTTGWRIFQFKIADITTPESGYEVDWIRTFKSVEELNDFMKYH